MNETVRMYVLVALYSIPVAHLHACREEERMPGGILEWAYDMLLRHNHLLWTYMHLFESQALRFSCAVGVPSHADARERTTQRNDSW